MTDAVWERECRTYSRFLIRQEPGGYVEHKYKEFHRRRLDASAGYQAFDHVLIPLSRLHPWAARFTDTYASRFMRNSALRRKVVLTMALLECSSLTFETLDTPSPGGVAGAILHGSFQAGFYVLLLVLSAVVLGPLHVLTATAAAWKRTR